MNKNKKILKALLAPASLLNKIIKKSPKRLFFYSNLGFRDNVKALYDYCIKEKLNSEYKITVATDEYKRFKEDAPENVKFTGLKRGIFYFLVSKYCFYSFGKYPIKPSRCQCVVNLWHGMPLKGIGALEKGNEDEEQNFFSFIIATSPFFAEVMKKAFKAKDEQVIITPQPRCDDFLIKTDKPEFLKGYDKIILWLPTFMSSVRLNKTDGEYGSIGPFDTELLKKLSIYLKGQNILLIIKPHPMDSIKIPKEATPNVLYINEMQTEQNGGLYKLLCHTDALITDFSSIYFDYLLLDRQIAFACPDIEKYKQSRGFAFENPQRLMPGEKIESIDDLLGFLKAVSNGEDRFFEQRRACNEICNSYKNISGAQLILNKIGILNTKEN